MLLSGKMNVSFGHLVAASCFGHLQWLHFFCVMKVVDSVFCSNFYCLNYTIACL
jgi:hypothetical protein